MHGGWHNSLPEPSWSAIQRQVGRVWGTRDNGGPAGYTKRVYKVKRGDTLGQIAENFRTRASKIRRWNNMKYGSHLIRPGQKLVIWVK